VDSKIKKIEDILKDNKEYQKYLYPDGYFSPQSKFNYSRKNNKYNTKEFQDYYGILQKCNIVLFFSILTNVFSFRFLLI
jgi:hypothetical protein